MRFARQLFRTVILALTLVVGTAAAALIVTQTAWFKNWLRTYLIDEARQYLNGELSIDRLRGNLFFGVELENLAISMEGHQIVAVKDVGLDYNVFEIVSEGVSLDHLRLNEPVVTLAREGGRWSLANLVKPQDREADREGPSSPIAIEEIVVSDGTVIIEDATESETVKIPHRVERIDARMSFAYEPVRYTIDISDLTLRVDAPAAALNSFSGTISVRDDTVFLDRIAIRTAESAVSLDGAIRQYTRSPVFTIRASSDTFSLPEVARFVPALERIALQPAFEIDLDGPLDRLGIRLHVRSSAGEVKAEGVADVKAMRAARGSVSVRELNLAAIRRDLPVTAFTGKVSLDVHGDPLSDVESVQGRIALNAPRLRYAKYAASDVRGEVQVHGRQADINAAAIAYGTRLSTRGRLSAAGAGDPFATLAYDLEGVVRALDMRRVPADLRVPPVATDLNGTYAARGVEPLSGKSLGREVAGRVHFADSTVSGADVAQGSTVNFTLRHAALSYDADLTVANVNPQRIGEAFELPALASERYAGTVNAHVVVSGHGTSLDTLAVEARGEVADTAILGAHLPQATFDARVENRRARVQAAGKVVRLNPAVASGRPALEGTIDGDFDVHVSISDLSDAVVLDEIEASGKVTLGPSEIGGLAIDRASLDADLRGRTGEVRQLEVVGRDFNAEARGALALDEAGASDLLVSIDTSRLGEIGKLFDLSLEGIGHVKGKVTGNRSELRAEGSLTGDGLKYGSNGALSLTSTFTASMPQLDVERLEVVGSTDATFVTIAGQNVNEVSAKTTYSARKVVFDATAREPERTLAAAGQLTLHPEHQEVHLERFALASRGLEWQLAAGSEPAIQYGGGRVTLDAMTLVSRDQEMTASGAFGGPGDELKVELRNFDLADVDAVLLREPQLSGRADVLATVTGTRDMPAVQGEVHVRAGGFRAFRYDALTAAMKYEGGQVEIDGRLQQNPSQWLTAKGTVPTLLFGDTRPSKHASASAALIDLTIDSSPIDLGLVQGMTTELTDVKGTFEAHVRVTGTADNPQPDGKLTLQDGAIRVRSTGAAYNSISGTVELAGDRVRVPLITVLDNHSNPLSVTGELAIDERRVGDVQLYVNATDFKVIDNELGELRIESALELVGDLVAPRLTGYLGLNSGRLNLDEIIAVTGTSPYPVEESGTIVESGQPAAQSPFDRLTMAVDVAIPDDLVVSADSLEVQSSPISLGSLTATLGGDLQIAKSAGGPVRVLGSVNTVRGAYQFQGRRFEILRDGTVRFAGLDELDPVLDLRTRRVIQGVEAFVNVRGTLRKPEIVLTSSPPLESADILSLIVFNQPANELGLGEQMSLAERAQALAAGAVASQLARSIGNVFALDTFEIDVTPETGNDPQLIIGQQVGQNLYVRIHQSLGDDLTNVILEYQLSEWLRLQTNFLQGSTSEQSLFKTEQGSGVDLIFFFSY